MAKQLILWSLLTLVFLFPGCAQKHLQPEPICLANLDLQSAMKQSEFVLVRMNFVVDKADVTTGVMKTKPLSGSQFFEIWRRDNRDGYSSALSNLHSIQRIAVLNFTPQNDLLCIDCNVTIERLSLPEKDVDSSARAYDMFSRSNRTRQMLKLEDTQLSNMQWVNIGRDSNFEAYILKKINQKIIKGRK